MSSKGERLEIILSLWVFSPANPRKSATYKYRRKGYDSALLVSCTILFCQGCHNVIKGGLNNRNLLLEAGSPSSHQGWFLVRLSFWLADGRLRTLCSQGLSSVGTWTETSSGVSSPYKGISPIGLGCCTYDLI